tara:strand:+ start:1133 stop:2422 length:1290 start_codon:yes stop_codon:yes gene_type:complete
MYKRIKDKEAVISVIGLGYVGLPIALEFAKRAKVIGFDINPDRIELMTQRIDSSKELEVYEFEGCDIEYTTNAEDIKIASFHIIAVPTPINDHNQPDLTAVLAASKTVGLALKKGDYVIYESTVYPDCTEEDCVPVLEELSGLKMGVDFKVGFSPERINPGDKVNTLTTITKVVSGSDEEALENVAKVYQIVIKAGVHRASSLKVAEAAKIIENTQWDVNIALMNELSLIFDKMDINTYDVLEAAGTKWNFLKFFPGLVGGHCIGVDPYYLLYKAKEVGHHGKIIDSGRFINDRMGSYFAGQIVKKIIAENRNIKDSRVLVMGVTFKEDVADIRNSKVVDVVKELQSFGVNVDAIDPFASIEEVKEEYGYDMVQIHSGKYDAVIVAVQHEEYRKLTEKYFKELLIDNGLFVDLKGIFKDKFKGVNYWSL